MRPEFFFSPPSSFLFFSRSEISVIENRSGGKSLLPLPPFLSSPLAMPFAPKRKKQRQAARSLCSQKSLSFLGTRDQRLPFLFPLPSSEVPEGGTEREREREEKGEDEKCIFTHPPSCIIVEEGGGSKNACSRCPPDVIIILSLLLSRKKRQLLFACSRNPNAVEHTPPMEKEKGEGRRGQTMAVKLLSTFMYMFKFLHFFVLSLFFSSKANRPRGGSGLPSGGPYEFRQFATKDVIIKNKILSATSFLPSNSHQAEPGSMYVVIASLFT